MIQFHLAHSLKAFGAVFQITLALLFSAFAARGIAQENRTVTYDDQIAPLLKRHCYPCHGEVKQEAGLNLASYAGATKGGSGGAVVVSGRSSSSRLFQVITAQDAAERMPPENDPLPPDQVALIKAWIDSGLRQNAGSEAVPSRTMSFTPLANEKMDGASPMPENLPIVVPFPTRKPFPILALAASPRAPLVAVAGYQQIDFIAPATRERIGSVPFPEGEPHVLRFSRNGSVLLAAGGRPVQNGVAVLFDVKTGRRLAEIGNETDTVLAADLSPNQQLLAIGGSGRTIKVFSTQDGAIQYTLQKHTDWITSLAFSPDGKLLASADRVGNIHLWDSESGGVILPLSEHKMSVRALSWRSDNQVLASCGEDGLIVWWEVAKGWPTISKPDAHPPKRPANTYGKIANGVLDADFGPAGELVTSGRDRTIRLWSSDGNLIKTFALDIANTDTASLAPAANARISMFPLRSVITFDGSTLLTGDSAGQLHSWPLSASK